jgi:hypothetical protein
MRSLSRPAKGGKITVRNTVILTIAGVIGAAAGVLTYLATRSLAQALLTAGAATGGSANLLGQIIGAGPERMTSALDGKQRDDEDDSTRQ